jgi:hypothetical protein
MILNALSATTATIGASTANTFNVCELWTLYAWWCRGSNTPCSRQTPAETVMKVSSDQRCNRKR